MYIFAAGGGTIEDCFFDQTAGPTASIQNVYGALSDAPQLTFDGGGGSWADTVDAGPWGSNWQVLGCSFKPLANAICATSSPCINVANGAKNIYVAGCIYVHNDSQKFVPSGPGRLLLNVDAQLGGKPANGLANHRFAANYGILGENGSPAVGYLVGAADPSIVLQSLLVVSPTAQVGSQYEVCPQFSWDSGGWWVTGKTAAGYTLNWNKGRASPLICRLLSVTLKHRNQRAARREQHATSSRQQKKGHRLSRCPLPTSNLNLLILVERAGSIFFALRYWTRRSGCGRGRDYGRGAVALEQYGNHRAFGFLHEGEFAFAEQVDADEIAELYLSGGDEVGERIIPGGARWRASGGGLRILDRCLREAGILLPWRVQLKTNWCAPEAISTRCCTMPSSISRIC